MLFYCCVAHPTLMMKRSFFETFSYKQSKMEDYHLWLSLIHDESIQFANIGTVLLKLRKHPGNASKQADIEEEVVVKRNLLKTLMNIEATPEVFVELIKVTGRSLKTQEELSKLKYRKQLVTIFD